MHQRDRDHPFLRGKEWRLKDKGESVLINIDGKQIELPDQMIHHLLDSVIADTMDKYQEIEPTYRIGIKTFLRTFIFPALEKALKIPVRPAKQVDPVAFLLINIANIVQDTSKHAAIDIKTIKSDGSTHRPTAFNLTLSDSSESGRQLAFNWSEGERQDNIREEVTR